MLAQPVDRAPAGLLTRLRALLPPWRRSPAQLGYGAALEAFDAALAQIAVSHDPWVRMHALCQAAAAQQAAAALAAQLPDQPLHPPIAETAAEVGIDPASGRTVDEVHRDAAVLLDWLAATERNLATGGLFDGMALTRHNPPLNSRWADVLIRLSAVSDPRMRAGLILEFGLSADRGGPVADVLYQVARAYLDLAGPPDAASDLVRLHREVDQAVQPAHRAPAGAAPVCGDTTGASHPCARPEGHPDLHRCGYGDCAWGAMC